MSQILQVDNRWEIVGNISVDNANALLQASNSLTIADGTVVDFAKVDEIDTAAISLMLEWRRRAIRENYELKFANLPSSLSSLKQVYGVAELLD